MMCTLPRSTFHGIAVEDKCNIHKLLSGMHGKWSKNTSSRMILRTCFASWSKKQMAGWYVATASQLQSNFIFGSHKTVHLWYLIFISLLPGVYHTRFHTIPCCTTTAAAVAMRLLPSVCVDVLLAGAAGWLLPLGYSSHHHLLHSNRAMCTTILLPLCCSTVLIMPLVLLWCYRQRLIVLFF